MGLRDLFKKKEDEMTENDINSTEEEVQATQEVAEEVAEPITESVKEEKQEEESPVEEKKNSALVSNERRNEIGPIVFQSEIAESDLEPLTIQETIFLLCSVDHFNEQSEMENYEQKCEMIDRVLAKKLAEADSLYMLFDRLTKFPFIMQGCVEVYSDVEFAEEALKHYSEQYRVLEIKVIRGGKGAFPDDMNLFEYLNYLGMEHILVDNGKFKTVVERNDVLPIKEDNSKIELEKPIKNPTLRHAIIDFFEEARWPVNYEKREEVMKTKEDCMLAELKEAKLLVPMMFEGEQVDKVQNQVEKQPGRNMIIPKIETKEHVAFTPIFTDWSEFTKIYPKDKWNGLILSFDEAISLNSEMGIVVNPMGENLIMNQQSFEALKQREN